MWATRKLEDAFMAWATGPKLFDHKNDKTRFCYFVQTAIEELGDEATENWFHSVLVENQDLHLEFRESRGAWLERFELLQLFDDLNKSTYGE